MRRASLRHMNWKILKLLLIPVAVCSTAATRSLAQEAEVSAVEVTGSVPTGLRQNMPVGPYKQPCLRAAAVDNRVQPVLDAGIQGRRGGAQFS